MEDELWKRYPRYMELTQPRPVTVEALQRTLLRAGEALVSYYLLPDRVLVFFVAPDRFRLVQVPRARSGVAALVAAIEEVPEAVSRIADGSGHQAARIDEVRQRVESLEKERNDYLRFMRLKDEVSQLQAKIAEYEKAKAAEATPAAEPAK